MMSEPFLQESILLRIQVGREVANKFMNTFALGLVLRWMSALQLLARLLRQLHPVYDIGNRGHP
jgi:hypothetical protein